MDAGVKQSTRMAVKALVTGLVFALQYEVTQEVFHFKSKQSHQG
jgi:hypothetical protein